MGNDDYFDGGHLDGGHAHRAHADRTESDRVQLDSWEERDDGELEDLLARYVDRLNRGEHLDSETILAENPDAGEELLEYLEGFVEMVDSATASCPRALGGYTLTRQIGRGGMGIVYDAWENSMERRVAVKVLPPGVAADRKSVSRFLREARVAGKLHHPNIVSVYGMGMSDQTPFYAMEYVEGATLAQLLERQREGEAADEPVCLVGLERSRNGSSDVSPGPSSDSRRYCDMAVAFAEVASGLQHAHAAGVVHRDIKPSNLILENEGLLRILDFGLARLEGQESLTGSGECVGTAAYMSPEQASADKIPLDHRTDIYSLGATMYETLTLRPPFRGKDTRQTLSQIVTREPVEPCKLNSRVPRDLETIVLKCLRKAPRERYGTAGALAEDLQRFVRGDPVEAQPPSKWEKTGRFLRRHRAAVIAGAGVLLLALVGFAWSYLMIAAKRDEITVQRDEITAQRDEITVQRDEIATQRDEITAQRDEIAAQRDELVSQRALRERDLYVSQMRDARASWEAGSLRRFVGLLERHVPVEDAAEDGPDLRGWEWHYLDALRRQDLFTFEAHDGPVYSARWSPDGAFLASGGGDARVKVWSLASGAAVFDVAHGSLDVNAVCWSPDGPYVVSGADRDRLIRFWDPHSGRQEFTLPGGPEPSSKTSKCAITALTFNSGGTRLAAAWGRWNAGRRESGIRVLDPIGREAVGRLDGPAAWLSSVTFSPDATRLAAGTVGLSPRPDEVIVWDTAMQKELHARPLQWAWWVFVDWSPVEALLAEAHEQREVSLWDPETQDETHVEHTLTSRISRVAWSPDGQTLALGAQNGMVGLWDVDRGEQLGTLRGHLGGIWSLAWGTGGLLASGDGKGQIKIWDTSRPAGYRTLAGNGHVAFSPDGELIATQDEEFGTEVILEVASGKTLRKLPGSQEEATFTVHAAFSPDGRLLAVISTDGFLRVWEWQTERTVHEVRAKSHAVAFSPDGRLLAQQRFARGKESLRVRDTATWEVVRTFPSQEAMSSAWSPDGRWLASVGTEKIIRIWDTATWSEDRSIPWGRGHARLAWSPDGHRLAGAWGGSFTLWDASSGEQILTVESHASQLKSLAFNPSGERLATGSTDGTVKIWDVASGNELLTLRFGSGRKITEVHCVAWSPDGRTLAAADGYQVKLWEAPGYGGHAADD